MSFQYNKRLPFFLSLEGVNGSGKSYVIPHLVSVFEQNNLPVVTTRELGGTPFGEALRIMSFDKALTDYTQLMLIFANRLEHLDKFIKKNLAEGVSVICDRFLDSTYIYQGIFHGIPIHKIETIEMELGLHLYRPDYTFLLDAPTEILQARCVERGRGCRYDNLCPSDINRMRIAYTERAAKEKNRFRLFNTSNADCIANMQSALRDLIKDSNGKIW